MTPYASAASAAPARAAPAYSSPRWPLLLLGVVSLLCVLGLVPLGMFVYRTRLPPPAPTVVPSGTLAPTGAEAGLAALRAVPELWASAARTLVPIPAGGVATSIPTPDVVGDTLSSQATALAEAGLRAARDALGQRLLPRGLTEPCAAPPPAEPCGAPGVVRGR